MSKFKPKNFDPEIDPIRQYIPTKKQLQKIWNEGYGEVSYIDHYPENLLYEGTEDFSKERWRATVHERTVWQPSGRFNVNGSILWERVGTVKSRSVKECTLLAKKLYTGQIKITKEWKGHN